MSESPFVVTVYDKTLKRVGWVGGYRSLTLTLAHNGVSNAWLTLDGDDDRVAKLMVNGTRLAVDYNGDRIFTGPIHAREGGGPRNISWVTFNAQSDFRILRQMLAWPNPSGDITVQGSDEAYDKRSGFAETVFKEYVVANAPRYGMPISVATDLARGASTEVQMRFHPLTDRLIPAVELAGLGVTVKQVGTDAQGTGFEVDVYEPTVRARLFTEESGILTNWNWNLTGPDATRAIAGGGGEGVLRELTEVTDSALEAEWGFTAEIFKDARDVDTGNTALLNRRASDALAEAGVTSGINVTLAETETFRYGRAAVVGDLVTVEVAPGVQITDVLRTVSIKDTPDNGVEVVPSVGETQSSNRNDMLIAKAIASLARGLRDLRVR